MNELLKIIPALGYALGHLLVFAMNLVANIDVAVLRPRRFDLVMPIGPPDFSVRVSHWQLTLASLDKRDVDIEEIANMTETYTPGDIDLATQRAATVAFDRIKRSEKPLSITSDDFETAIASTRPSVSSEVRHRFAEKVGRFAGV